MANLGAVARAGDGDTPSLAVAIGGALRSKWRGARARREHDQKL